eukprot:CAMPEP_0118863072 /NCGR_PEP_ID=MMETSP1163-20130328/8071_1 /TAXON_ID=124430 /ORGANISM="Phaeomonas parva, Strain CCMP2877" /LENGTH=84 /DNA_ID=CAMNT_0006797043 /DNA_START=139 /DNA_END=391 /DNA_ORIENTATION=-
MPLTAPPPPAAPAAPPRALAPPREPLSLDKVTVQRANEGQPEMRQRKAQEPYDENVQQPLPACHRRRRRARPRSGSGRRAGLAG